MNAFQSTLPGWGATRQAGGWISRPSHFNPRSPDGERPMKRPCTRSTPQHFNPRSPDGERPLRRPVCRIHAKFQSTLPGWGATWCPRIRPTRSSNFNPRSPDGERRGRGIRRQETFQFQSTLPGWGATSHPSHASRPFRISIHAPRMGSDNTIPTGCPANRYFNPRSPDGERRKCLKSSSLK